MVHLTDKEKSHGVVAASAGGIRTSGKSIGFIKERWLSTFVQLIIIINRKDLRVYKYLFEKL